MTAWLIFTGSLVAYLPVARSVARRWYASHRLLTEPTACTYKGPYPEHHEHGTECFKQHHYSVVDSNTEWAVFSALVGLGWPFYLLCLAGVKAARRMVAGADELTS